jgi:hypothetical protein
LKRRNTLKKNGLWPIHTEVQAKFVELQVQGWTFDKIAAELNAAKTTLLNWQGLHRRTSARAGSGRQGQVHRARMS